LPAVVRLDHTARAVAVQPGFGFGIGSEMSIPKGGAQREDGAVPAGHLMAKGTRMPPS
jgi:hypothetical protein